MSPPVPGFGAPPAHTTRPDLLGSFGMCASTHWVASASAQSVLERGGNAFDAAVCGAFVLHVVEPHLNGPGGDMTGVFATAADPAPTVLMGQGPAPAGATIAHVRAEGLDQVPGSGALAAAVPGAVDAWLLLLRDHGTWELADVLEHAIGYAEHGHPAGERVVATIGAVEELFTRHWPSSAETWLAHGRVPRAGEVLRLPVYAATLRRLVRAAGGATREERVEAARREWSTGFVAEAVEEFVPTPHRHSTGTDHAGVLTGADLAAFSAGYEPAVTRDFHGVTVAKTGAWGQGPVLLQALAILDGFAPAEIDPGTPDGAHRVLEALKLAMADREAYYGDPGPDEPAVPLDVLLSGEYGAARRALIGDRASLRLRPGTVPGHAVYLPPLHTADGTIGAGAGEPTVQVSGRTRGDTCHLDVVDRWGNLVAVTPSGGWLQSSPTIPALGFCLGTRLQMTQLDPGAPSALRPGRRPRTTLSPTLLLRDGVPVTAMGTPGGDQQDQWQLPYLLRTVLGGWSAQQAVDAPTLHTTSMPGSFWPRHWTPGGAVVEDRAGEELIAGLERRGHVVTRAGDWALGRLSSVTRDPATGRLSAAANPRGAQGYAVGR